MRWKNPHIDGANDLVIFLQIMIPLSMPIMHASFYSGVGYWNDLYTCLFYIRDETKTVLQVELYRMISDSGNTGSFSRATSTSSSMLNSNFAKDAALGI